MFSLIELTYCIYILLQRELQFILEKKKKNLLQNYLYTKEKIAIMQFLHNNA
jgi:hypothetical protein